MIDIDKIIRELRCKTCDKYYLHHIKNGPDFRCFECKYMNMTCEQVQEEIAKMSEEEYKSFLDDIEEYKEKHKEK